MTGTPRILSDAGFQVHYTGIRRTPEEIVDQAIALEVDAVGLSLLSGAHNLLFPRVIADLRQRGHEEILVFGGGVIPANDVAHLRSVGVAAVFTPGASARDIVNTLRALLAQQADATADCVEVSR